MTTARIVPESLIIATPGAACPEGYKLYVFCECDFCASKAEDHYKQHWTKGNYISAKQQKKHQERHEAPIPRRAGFLKTITLSSTFDDSLLFCPSADSIAYLATERRTSNDSRENGRDEPASQVEQEGENDDSM
jgi:hypothetical protein